MKKLVLTLIALTSFVFAADAPASYNACKACHGVKGEKNINTQNKTHVPANLTKAEIESALHGYKDGSYGGPLKALMKPQAMRLKDEDIKALANYMGK